MTRPYKFFIPALFIAVFLLSWNFAFSQTGPRKQDKEDFRPFKLKQIGIGMTFFQWDSEPQTAEAFHHPVNYSFSFSRTYHKKWFWGPGWMISPFTEFHKIKLTSSGSLLTGDSSVYSVSGFKNFQSTFGVFNRITFKAGGKTFLTRHPSVYLDIGVMGSISWLFRYYTKTQDADFGRQETVIHRGIPRNPFVSGFARLGLSFISLYGSWRFTPFMDKNVSLPEIPALQAGIILQIPLFKPERKNPTWEI